MKNNFITKIIGATLAFAMMIGGAVGINAAKQAKEVDAATVSGTFNKYSGILTEGDYVVAHGTSKAMMNTTANTRINATSISVENNAITNPDESIVWHISASGNYWTFYNAAVSKYAASTGAKNKGQLLTSGTDDMSLWSCSSNGNSTTYDFVNKKNTANSVNATLRYNSANADDNGPFAAYSTSTGTALTLYKKDTSGGQSLTALADPNPQYNNSTKKVTWTTDAHATKYQIKVDAAEFEDISITPNPEYDASGLTTGVQHTVQIKAVGDGTSYSSTTGSVQFTPTVPFVPKEYALCTSISDLEAGAKYIFTSGTTGTVKAMSTESNTNNRKVVDATVNAQTHRITSTSDVLVVELGGSEDHWTFETTNYSGDNGYFVSSGSSNYLKISANAGEATISFTNSYAVIHLGPSTTNDLVRYNSGSSLFSCYSSGQSPVYMWKEFKELDHLDVTGELEKTSYYDSETFDSTGLTISAVYTNSTSRVLAANAVVWQTLEAGMTQIRGSYTELGITKYTEYFNITVTADALSTVALSGSMGTTYFTTDNWSNGSLVVTATYASGRNNVVTDSATIAFFSDSAMQNEVATPGDLGPGADQTIYVKATYEGVSNTTGYAQTVTVTVEHGSVSNDPLTVAEAVEKGNTLAHNAQTPKQYYIQGTVSRIDDNKLGQEGNYVFFWLQNGEVTEGFEVYNITPAAGCTNYNDMKVGAEVLIRCQIKKYSSTIETGTAKSLISISYTAPTLTSISLNKTSLFLAVGEDEQLTASPAPIGAELGTVTWKSSNIAVATVDQDGNVSAVASGSTTITAFIDENDNGSVDGGEINATCSVTVNCKATMKYESNTTTNMAASGNAATVNLDSNMFTVDAAKGGNSNFPGLNKADEIRAYSGNDIIITINSNYTITSAVFDYGSGSSSSQVFVGNTLVTGNDDAYEINSNSFKIHASGATVTINSIDIFYRDATTVEKVNYLETRSTLSYSDYHAGENDTFTFDNLAIRFGGLINKDLWDALDTNEHLIQGYGVMISYEDLAGETFESYYNQSKAGNTVEETIDFMFDNDGLDGDADDGLIFGKDYYFPLSNEKTHPAEATASQKAGKPEGTYYIWNLYKNVSMANAAKEYFAVAYIRVGDELVFLAQTSASTSSLASYLINSGAYADDAFGGSLAYLASL